MHNTVAQAYISPTQALILLGENFSNQVSPAQIKINLKPRAHIITLRQRIKAQAQNLLLAKARSPNFCGSFQLWSDSNKLRQKGRKIYLNLIGMD